MDLNRRGGRHSSLILPMIRAGPVGSDGRALGAEEHAGSLFPEPLAQVNGAATTEESICCCVCRLPNTALATGDPDGDTLVGSALAEPTESWRRVLGRRPHSRSTALRCRWSMREVPGTRWKLQGDDGRRRCCAAILGGSGPGGGGSARGGPPRARVSLGNRPAAGSSWLSSWGVAPAASDLDRAVRFDA